MIKNYSFSIHELRLLSKALDNYGSDFKKGISSGLFPFPDAAREQFEEIHLLSLQIDSVLRDFDSLPYSL